MAIIYRSTSPASSVARSIDWVDKGRRQAFSHYLQSIGLDPVIADVIDPADFCRIRDAAWEEVIRQIRGHAPDPDPSVHVREIINRLGRLAGNHPTPGHELDEILDDIDLSEASDEDRFPFFTPARLNSGQFETRYLIDGVLAAGQPGGIFGAFKTLKTSVTADLLISLASGTPFLGQFPVSQPGPTLFLSGESGLAALQSIVRRICRARGLSLEAVDNFELSPKLPQFDRAADVRALRRIIRERQPICVAIDPAYLAVGGEATHNLFAMGALLRPLAEICQTTGCTVLVVHHCKRSQQTRRSPASLEDVAWAGFAEFSAQWLTLSRRRRFDPELGRHELWLSAGGRSGHHGLWALDVSEGVAGGREKRKWKAAIRPVSIAEAQSEERTFADCEDRRARQVAVAFERNRRRVLEALALRPAGETARGLRLALGLNAKRLIEVLESLVDEERLVVVKIERHDRTEVAYRLPTKPADSSEATRGGTSGPAGTTKSGPAVTVPSHLI